MLGALEGAPDFPEILTGLADAALEGDASAFLSGPPPLGAVVAMPILANDYSDYSPNHEKMNTDNLHRLRTNFRCIPNFP